MKVSTPEEIAEEATRTLYLRLPHTIKNMDEIRELVFNESEIHLPRQSSRHCHVVFPNVAMKVKNMKALKKKKIDNKKIFVTKPQPKKPKEKKIKRNKARKVKPTIVEKPKKEFHNRITRICFVKKIPLDATFEEIKALFKEAKNVALLKNHHRKDEYQLAIVKFKDPKSAAAYLNKEKPAPTLRGARLQICPDERKQKASRKNKKKDEDIKEEPKEQPKEETKEETEEETKEEIESEDNEAVESSDDEDPTSEEIEYEIEGEGEDGINRFTFKLIV